MVRFSGFLFLGAKGMSKSSILCPQPLPSFNVVGNFHPGASFSQNTFSVHATDFFIRRVVLGQESSILKICREIDVNLSFWCSFDYFDIFPNIVQVIWIKVWMAVTKLTHSKQKVDVCRFV